MNLKDGTLLICFLGDRTSGGRTVPRVAIWRENRSLEEVTLSWAAARMIAQLTRPREPSFSGTGVRGRTDRIAAALTSSLSPHSARQLRAALGYGKTQEWRARRDLLAHFAAQGLERHVSSARGRIGLVDAVSDVAALVAAVRHDERGRAVHLLEAVGGGAPDQVDWLLSEGWSAATRELADEAIGQAKAWSAQPRLLPTLASDAGDREPSTKLAISPATGETHLPSPPVPWTPRPVGRPRRQRIRLRWLATGALAAVVALAASAILLDRSSPARASLPGAWPSNVRGGVALVANLTKGAPLSNGIAASRGDVLLLRVHLPTGQVPGRTTQRVAVAETLWKVARDGLRFYASIWGLPPLRQEISWIATAEDDYRLEVVPGTTQLVDGSGHVVRSLRDLVLGKWDWAGRLPTNRSLFIDTQLKVVKARPNSPGQVSADSSVRCNPSSSSGQTVEIHSGSVTACIAHLVNLGPGVLPTVAVHIGSVGVSRRVPQGPNLALRIAARSASAEPRRSSFTQYLRILGGRRHNVAYVPRSARLFDSSLQPEREGFTFTEKAGRGELFLGPLGPGAENGLFLRFKIRVR